MTLTLNVSAINDAPVLTSPGLRLLDEDTTITFSANSNTIVTSDPDVAETDPSKVQPAPTVTQGTLKLATLQDITVDIGTDESSSMTLP